MRVFRYLPDNSGLAWTMIMDEANDQYRFDPRNPWQQGYQLYMSSLVDLWLRNPDTSHVTDITHTQVPEGL